MISRLRAIVDIKDEQLGCFYDDFLNIKFNDHNSSLLPLFYKFFICNLNFLKLTLM